MTASEIQTIPESAAEGSDPMLLMTITGRVQFQFPSTNLLFAEKKGQLRVFQHLDSFWNEHAWAWGMEEAQRRWQAHGN